MPPDCRMMNPPKEDLFFQGTGPGLPYLALGVVVGLTGFAVFAAFVIFFLPLWIFRVIFFFATGVVAAVVVAAKVAPDNALKNKTDKRTANDFFITTP